MKKLPGIIKNAHRNNVTNVKMISREEILKLEPHLSRDALGGKYLKF